MIYKVLLSPRASKNIDNAIDYYNREVSKKVAKGFLKDFHI
jgi:hypothetical protein